MIKRASLLIAFVLVCCTLQDVAARGEDTKAETIEMSGLAAKAERMRRLDGTDNIGGVVLTKRVEVPTTNGLTVVLRVHSWRPVAPSADTAPRVASASIKPLGTLAWQPVAVVELQPYMSVHGQLVVADSLSLDVRWSALTPQVIEQPIVVVGNTWYDPQRPYARIRTANDGVAFLLGEEILGVNQAFENTPTTEVAMFWKGAEQYIAVIDADNNSIVSRGDTVLFQGRRPTGDSTYYDMDDSVSVFFLTRIVGGLRNRLVAGEHVQPQQTLDNVVINTHIEQDTGYYHLGSTTDSDVPEFNADLTWLEGFYWARLNANGYEKIAHKQMITPAPQGSSTISAHYAATANVAAFAPDTRADLTINGTDVVFLESDGIERYSLQITVPSERLVSGLQSFKLFSSGIDSLRHHREYQSDVLLEAFTIRADVLPVLDSGRMRITMQTLPQPVSINFSNATGYAYAIDTLQHQFYRLPVQSKQRVIRSGLSPRDKGWITDAVPQGSWRASATIDDAAAEIDSVSAFALVEFNNTSQQLVATLFENADALAARINQGQTNAPCVVMNAGGVVTQPLRTAMTSRGMQVPDAAFWTVNSVLDKPSISGSSAEQRAFGATLRISDNTSPRNSVSLTLTASGDRTLFVADTRGLEHARTERSHLHNLGGVTEQVDVFIVTHSTHWKQAERLAAHRRALNSVTVRVVDVDEIIDEYGAGHRSPEALRSYLASVYASAPLPRPTYVVLFGAASWDARLAVKNGNVGARMPDEIPAYGRPSSDYYYSMLDDPHDYAVPEVIVGRLPAISEADGKAIVDKIIEQDTASYQPWRRRWMFVGGGTEQEGLCNVYQDMLDDTFGTGITYTAPPFCMDTVTLCKYTAPANAGYYIKLEIDQGVQWLNYIGHGAPDQFDITGWDPNELSNTNKYGVLATYACQTGAFSNPSKPCKNAQYLTEPGRGFAAAMGGSGWEYKLIVSQLHYYIHETMRDTSVAPMFRNVGDVMYEAKTQLVGTTQDGINTAMQYCLLGDPMMRIHMDTVVDVLVRRQDVTVVSNSGSAEITDGDSTATLNIQIQNRGIGTEQPFLVCIRHTFQSATETQQTTVNGICIGSRVTFSLNVLDMPGDHTIVITADCEAALNDDASNNSITTTFTVLPRSLLPLEPVAHGFIDNTAWHVRVLDPTTTPGTSYFAICKTRSRAEDQILLRSTESEVQRSRSIVDWSSAQMTSVPTGPAWLAAWMILDSTQKETAVMWLPVNITSGKMSTVVNIPAHRMATQTPEFVVYDSTRALQKLYETKRNIYIRSSGLNTPDIFEEPVFEFRVGEVTYAKNPFFRGINLMLVNEYDSIPHTIRRYDTYWDPLPMETGNNGSTHELLQFLRDSVAPSDRVCFASCNEAFTGFADDHNLDSLIDILHSYGSAFADSLDTNSSWAMIGRKGLAPGNAPELWKGAPDSLVTLISPTPFYSKAGNVQSGWFGPARAWDSVVLDHAQRGVRAHVSGRMRDGSVHLLADLLDTTHVWTPQGNADELVWVAITWNLEHVAADTNAATVTSVQATFTPAHELIIEPDFLRLDTTEVLRGDSLFVMINAVNANRLASTPECNFRLQVEGVTPGSVAYQNDSLISSFGPDRLVAFGFTIPTDAAGSESVISIHLDPENTFTQFYTFNDRRTQILTVREDTTKPIITALADSLDVSHGGYVVREPLIEVIVRDNSKLPINDSSRLVVFINGDRIRSSNTTEYQWIPSPRCLEFYSDSTIRAALQFRYPLELGQNNLIVRCSDVTGNTAELEAELWTTDKTEIISVAPSPNPTSGPVMFIVDTRSNLASANATVQISDINGHLMSQIEGTLSLGKTSLVWNGKGSDGQSLPSGVYAYRLHVADADGAGLSDVRGTLMILR